MIRRRSSSFLKRFCVPVAAVAALMAAGGRQADAQPYATILYETWSNLIIGSSGTVGNDVADMMTESGYTGGYNWWGKPLFAETHGDGTIKNNYIYYVNNDVNQPNNALIDYHADLLSRAGMDFITIDFTNGAISEIVKGSQALCARFAWRKANGYPAPQIAFFVNTADTLQTVKNTFYNGQYPSTLFFNYLGKPLALVGSPNSALGAGDHAQPYAPTGGIYDSFTCRHCWGLDNSGAFWQFKTNAATPPPAATFNGAPEQMCASFACQGSYMTTDGVNPGPGAQGRNNGGFFNSYMTAARNTQPTFTFITGWNEWASINFNTPPAGQFVDEWKEGYSSDAEPEAAGDPGSHGYQYYDLMAQQIARLKGTFPVLDGGSYQILNQNSGECVDVPGGTNVHGTQLQQWPMNGASAQQWIFHDLGTGYWTITNAANGLALDDYGWNTANGGAVDQWDLNSQAVQQWSLRPAGDGSWKIVNRNSGRCLGVAGASKSNGALLVQWDDNGTADHNWYIQPYIATASYKIIASTTGNAMDVSGLGNGALAQLHPYTSGAAQKWTITNLLNGYYSIRNANGRSLDCTGCSPENGTQLELWDYNGLPCQLWQITPTGGGKFKISTQGTKADGTHDVLDGAGCSGATNTNVLLWSWGNGGCQQQWQIATAN